MSERPSEPTERDRNEGPRIWVGSLADYNAGRLHGVWLDAAVEFDELTDGVQRMLARSDELNAEEWGIFDFDGFAPFRLNEYDDLSQVAAVARGIAAHGTPFAVWAELHDGDEAMLEKFEDAFLGQFESEDAYIEQLLEDFGVNESLDRADLGSLRPYIKLDREQLLFDLQASGEINIERFAYQVYVFDAR